LFTAKRHATTKKGLSATGPAVFVVLFLISLVVPRANADGIDPHIIFATGGNGTPITTAGAPITLSDGGGGIFVFQNSTGADVSELDVSIQFPSGVFPAGFTVADILSPSLGVGDFSDALINNVTCADLGGFSSSTSCLDMVLKLMPGSFIGKGQNFVLDFDFPLTTADVSVENGTYTGGTDTSAARSGDWPSGAPGEVIPVTTTPEPGTLTLFAIGLSAAVARVRRRRA
jgi:hypothetical protein